MRVPVASAVIYVVSTAEECQVVKTSFDYEVEGSEPARIDQYRIFAMADTGAVVSGANDLAAQNGTGSPDDDAMEARRPPEYKSTPAGILYAGGCFFVSGCSRS